MAEGRRDGRTPRDRARGQGQPDHGAHAAARAVPRAPRARRRARRPPGLPRPLRRAEGRRHRDRADVRRRPPRRRATSSISSPSPSTCWPRSGEPGPDVPRARHGPRRDRALPARDAAAGQPAERLFSDDERGLRVPTPRPCAPPRGALRRQGSGDEGARRGARRVQAPRRRGGAAPQRRTRGRALREGGRAGRGAAASPGWHLSLTHTDIMAMAVAVALG